LTVQYANAYSAWITRISTPTQMADNITIETINLVTKKEEHTSTLMYGLNAEIPCL